MQLEQIIFDLVSLIIITIGLIRGFSKGFIIEVFQLLSIIIGIFGALKYAGTLTTQFQDKIALDPNLIWVSFFVILFCLLVIIISALARLITKLIKLAFLGCLNRVLGLILGGIKAILLLCLLVIIIEQIQDVIRLIPESYFEESFLYDKFDQIGQTILEWAKVNFPDETQSIL